MKVLNVLMLVGTFLFTGCMSDSQFKDRVRKSLETDPQILADVIRSNPATIMMAIQTAAKNAQGEIAKQKEKDEQKKNEEYFTNPMKPEIRKDETIRGTKGAPIVLVEYSDYECPYCSRAFDTVMTLLEEYKGKIQFVYKHLPLSFHKNAKIASQYYEALRLQSPDLAYKLHDDIYKNQGKLKLGESYLKKLAKTLGADMARVKKDLNSQFVLDRIAQDEKEAAKFGFQGTPGFLLNGIPIKGAYPKAYFDEMIQKLKDKGKISI